VGWAEEGTGKYTYHPPGDSFFKLTVNPGLVELGSELDTQIGLGDVAPPVGEPSGPEQIVPVITTTAVSPTSLVAPAEIPRAELECEPAIVSMD
jgi:hypothetical protein